jgi:hypothetical protein
LTAIKAFVAMAAHGYVGEKLDLTPQKTRPRAARRCDLEELP